MAWLIAVDEGLSGRRFSLDAPCLVGRGPYNHVVLNDTRVSRQHAKISPEAGGHVVYDLNSANGTYVNDIAVKRQVLTANDVVRFGPFSFRFESVEGSRPMPRVRPEELTRRGFEPPSKIVNTREATGAIVPPLTAGLAELEEAGRRLRTLYAFMQSVSTTLDIGELIERSLVNLLDVFQSAEVVAVYLRDPLTNEMTPRLLRRDRGPVQAFELTAQIQEEALGRGHSVLSAPVSSASRKDDKSATRGLSMHAPMISHNEALGVVHVRGGDNATMPFSHADLDLLTALAAQAAMALSNARMHHESLKQQRLQQDLVLAEQIQKSFLPSQLPAVRGIEFMTEYRPAYSVGGDFYDVFWLARERLAVFIGDVSGKGVSAALLMARVSSDLRAAALALGDPAQVMARLNRAVIERNQPDIFVTAIYLTLDVRTHRVELANAGHLPPLIRRAKGELQRIEAGAGTAIGILDDVEYEKVELELAPGDTMVLCTDGVLEATSTNGQQFGFEGLEASLANGSARAAELVERLDRDLRAHVGHAPQYDDLTMIVCGISDMAPTFVPDDDQPPVSTPVSWKSVTPLNELTLRPPPPRE